MTKKYNYIEKTGRPTKYYEGIEKDIEVYLSLCGRENMSLPTIEGLAGHLDVTSETIHQWVKKYPKFSYNIKKMAAKQKQQLMEDGMYGGKEVNQAMAIFLLKAVHGLNDHSQTLVQVNVKPLLGGISNASNDSDQEDIQVTQKD